VEKKPLTVSEALRFANHDFLNQLQLIQMNLDLQRVDEAKQVIRQAADQFKMLSNVNKIGLPRTIEWLQTAAWTYPAVVIELESRVEERASAHLDEVLAQYLENTMIHIYDTLDPFSEQQLKLTIESNADYVQIHSHYFGKWDAPQFKKELQYFEVQTIQQCNEQWEFILRSSKE
jgi:stage 0 sporulation protein B (sporulation initiation phosphotransferase)